MSGHTKGPWVAHRMHTGGFDIMDPRDRDVVTVYGGGVELESLEANARLIAAAPDLLEALKTLLAHDEQDAGCIPTDAHLDAQNAARAAITRADRGGA